MKDALEKAKDIPNGDKLTDLEKFCYVNADKYSTNKICEIMGCTSKEVKRAFHRALSLCSGGENAT
jgi:DNA-directed RNA polymerase specialized sigma24 family protein